MEHQQIQPPFNNNNHNNNNHQFDKEQAKVDATQFSSSQGGSGGSGSGGNGSAAAAVFIGPLQGLQGLQGSYLGYGTDLQHLQYAQNHEIYDPTSAYFAADPVNPPAPNLDQTINAVLDHCLPKPPPVDDEDRDEKPILVDVEATQGDDDIDPYGDDQRLRRRQKRPEKPAYSYIALIVMAIQGRI